MVAVACFPTNSLRQQVYAIVLHFDVAVNAAVAVGTRPGVAGTNAGCAAGTVADAAAAGVAAGDTGASVSDVAWAAAGESAVVAGAPAYTAGAAAHAPVAAVAIAAVAALGAAAAAAAFLAVAALAALAAFANATAKVCGGRAAHLFCRNSPSVGLRLLLVLVAAVGAVFSVLREIEPGCLGERP